MDWRLFDADDFEPSISVSRWNVGDRRKLLIKSFRMDQDRSIPLEFLGSGMLLRDICAPGYEPLEFISSRQDTTYTTHCLDLNTTESLDNRLNVITLRCCRQTGNMSSRRLERDGDIFFHLRYQVKPRYLHFE